MGGGGGGGGGDSYFCTIGLHLPFKWLSMHTLVIALVIEMLLKCEQRGGPFT